MPKPPSAPSNKAPQAATKLCNKPTPTKRAAHSPTAVKQKPAPRPAKKNVVLVDSLGKEYTKMPGNKKFSLDEEQLSQLSLMVKIGCTMEEIEQILKCDRDSIVKYYSLEIQAARKERNVAIRRKQYQLAMEGDRTMLVWLGKQWLGQSDQLAIGAPDGMGGNTGGAVPVFEIVFVESDGQGRPKIIEGETTTPKLTGGSK